MWKVKRTNERVLPHQTEWRRRMGGVAHPGTLPHEGQALRERCAPSSRIGGEHQIGQKSAQWVYPRHTPRLMTTYDCPGGGGGVFPESRGTCGGVRRAGESHSNEHSPGIGKAAVSSVSSRESSHAHSNRKDPAQKKFERGRRQK